MPSLEYVKGLVENLGRQLEGPSEDGAPPHVEIDARGFHYVVVERGKEISRKSTARIDDLLYWIFDDVTFNVACDHEVRHRPFADQAAG